jgi:hypothetical protein
MRSIVWSYMFLLPFAILSATPVETMASAATELRASGVILGQFETVFYSKGSLVARAAIDFEKRAHDRSHAYDGLTEDNTFFLVLPFTFLADGLAEIGGQAAVDLLHSSDAVLVGAKDFRAPSSFGMIQSKFCYVVALDRQNIIESRKIFQHLSISSIDHVGPVWTWTGRLREGQSAPITYYAATVADSYLLVSNTVDEMKDIVHQLGSPANGELKPSELRRLKQVEQCEYWAYRHSLDSVIGEDATQVPYLAGGVTGLSFCVNFRRRTGAFRVFGPTIDSHTVAAMNAYLVKSMRTGSPIFRLTGAGTCEATVDLTANPHPNGGISMLAIVDLLGFGIAM